MRSTILAARIHGPMLEGDGRYTLEFRFGSGNPLFAGHFPGRPLLPGVFQMEMARVAAELALGCRLAVREISKAKFVRPVLPEEIIRATVKWTDQDGKLLTRAQFFVGDQPAGETLLLLCRES